MKTNKIDNFLNDECTLTIKLTENGENKLILIPNFTSANKRGITINYYHIVLFEKELDDIVKMAQHKLPAQYIGYVKNEFFTLIGRVENYNLADFKETHPFGKKESMYLLQQYKKLYRCFANAVAHSVVTSKNIISTNATTCITTLQLFDDTLHVYQRSCDMSCGFLADALTINLFKQLSGAKHVRGFISAPHIYKNNLAETKKYFEDYNYKKRNFKIKNVR